MVIEYENKKIKKVCTDLKTAKKNYPDKIARKLHKVINFIEISNSLQDIINYSPFHFHSLKGDRLGQYAIDVGSRRDGYRLIVSFDQDKGEIIENSIKIKEILIKEMGNHYE